VSVPGFTLRSIIQILQPELYLPVARYLLLRRIVSVLLTMLYQCCVFTGKRTVAVTSGNQFPDCVTTPQDQKGVSSLLFGNSPEGCPSFVLPAGFDQDLF
jgi:hypothetical protein